MEAKAYIGEVEKSDTMGAALHDASKYGHTKRLKRILAKGINVDYPNSSGQSPLFCACYNDQISAAKILLKQGANPNERSLDGATPVHAACYSCNMKMLSRLLGCGGDLRLHDNLARTPRDWIMLQTEPKKKYKMLEFIEKTRYYAMSGNSKESVKVSNSIKERTAEQTNSVIRFVRNKIRGDSLSNFVGEANSVQSLGFGKVYLDNDFGHGMVSLVPLVSENCLRHDNDGLTYNNGSFMVMESMTWIHTDVTVKRLHRKPQDGGHVDLLINESEFMGKVHHPNVLLFMGICQTNNLDGLVLLYERINYGSFFHHIHDRFEEMSYENSVTIISQICKAVIFLHQQNLIHCSISSHAINLISPNEAKLGNFEYMVEHCSLPKKSLAASNTFPNAIFNWLAPELMEDKPPGFMTDMYGFCMVIYEIFEDKIPWEDCSADFIRQKLVLEGYSVSSRSSNIPAIFQAVLELGLQFEPSDRKLSFEQLLDVLAGISTKSTTGQTPFHLHKKMNSIPKFNLSDESGELLGDTQTTEEVNEVITPDRTTPKCTAIESVLPDASPHSSLDQSNNSPSDLSQFDKTDNALSVVPSSSCGIVGRKQQTKPKHVKIDNRREIISSTGKMRKVSIPGVNRRASVQMYRDEEDTFHYSVCIPSKSSSSRNSPKLSVGSASTLPRCKKESFKNSSLAVRLRDVASKSGSGDLKDNQENEVENTLKRQTSNTHSVSLPDEVHKQDFQPASPSALYKALPSNNKFSQSVEIVRDIKTELAKVRERRDKESVPVSFRSQPLPSTSTFRNDSSPKKFNYMMPGSPVKSSTVPLKPEVFEAMKRRNQILAESTDIKVNKAVLCQPTKDREKESESCLIKRSEGMTKTKSPKTPDRRWYGGMGSVKNLVKKYQQQQTETHPVPQSEEKEEENSSDKKHSNWEDNTTHVACDNTIKDLHEVQLTENYAQSSKSEPLTSASDINSLDSGDSEEILDWVNQHLDRIKKEMSFGVVDETYKPLIGVDSVESHDQVISEVSESSVLSTEQDLKIEVLPDAESCSSWSNTIDFTFSNTESNDPTSVTESTSQDTGSSNMEITSMPGRAEPEEFYFDDVIQPSLLQTKHLKLQGTSSVPNYSYEFKRVTERGRTVSEEINNERKEKKGKGGTGRVYHDIIRRGDIESYMGEEITPVSRSNKSGLVNKIDGAKFEEGHTTVLSVRSSRNLPGKHVVTHTEIDSKTGICETISKGTVKAQKVVSRVYTK